MIKTKRIGVMLMASSIIDKKLPRPGCRAEHRATDSRLRTRRKRSSLIPEQLSLSSRYFLKRSKIDISHNAKFLSAAVERTPIGLLPHRVAEAAKPNYEGITISRRIRLWS
jgi:hypothetical protein